MTQTHFKHTDIGPVPEHWEMRQWQYLLQENTTPNSDCKETNQLQFKYGEIISKANQEVDADSLKIISKYTKVQPNDIMINGLNLNYDFISQRIGMVRSNGIITSAYISLRPTDIANPAYYNYLLKAMDAQKMFHGMGTGVRLTLSYKELKNKYLPYPPLSEQEAMVAYLDEQTANIDQAIQREQAMIDLLEERKQIIIQQAVTKGLNPNAPMKDSGIDWIGEIPEGWKRTSLKRVCAIKTGKTPSTTRPAYFEDGTVNWYTPGDLNEFILVDSERKVTNLAAKEQACQVYPECSVYLVGIGGTIGKVAYSEVSASCNQQINVIIPDKESLDYKFLAYYLRTAKTEIYRGANLSTLPIINQDRTGALPIICPPIEEQKAIVVFIAKAADPIDKAIAAKNRVITLLQERKQIIVNEVVTGKIKVS